MYALLQLGVLLADLFREFLLVRIVELHKDEPLWRLGLEGVLVEDLGLEPFAPATPVRAGEIGQEEFLFRLGLRLGRLEVGQPKTVLGVDGSR